MLLRKKRIQKRKNQDQLANTSWPMIHCDPQGTKMSPFSGPTAASAKAILKMTESDVIVMLSTPKRLYVQEAANYVKAYDPQTLEVLGIADLGATFPFLAGGTLDKSGHLWYTANNRIARLSPDLEEVIWSEEFSPAKLAYNTCFFLPDGNLLVTSCSAAHVISPQLVDGTFKVISSLDLSSITSNGEKVFPFVPVMPRPVSDEEGGLYFTSAKFVTKLHYDEKSQSVLPNPAWTVPLQGSDTLFNLCDPVLVNDRVYAAAIPGETEAMHVYCMNTNTGEIESVGTPFPDAIQGIAAHTIGAVPDKNIVIAICNTEDLSGGMAAMDGETMEVKWHAPIAVIGGAFCTSNSSNRGYIISRDPEDSNLKYWAINLDNGEQTVLLQYYSDKDPTVSLPSIGYGGRLYYPNPSTGFALI